jgi:HEAT repeat protein
LRFGGFTRRSNRATTSAHDPASERLRHPSCALPTAGAALLLVLGGGLALTRELPRLAPEAVARHSPWLGPALQAAGQGIPDRVPRVSDDSGPGLFPEDPLHFRCWPEPGLRRDHLLDVRADPALLIPHMASSDPATRRAAGAWFHDLVLEAFCNDCRGIADDEPLLALTRDALAGARGEARRFVARALITLREGGAEVSWADFAGLFESSDPALRRQVSEYLEGWSPETPGEHWALLNLLEHADPRVRHLGTLTLDAVCLESFAEAVGRPRLEQTLSMLAEDVDPEVRRQVAVTLGSLIAEGLLRFPVALVRLRVDPDWAVREAAQEALWSYVQVQGADEHLLVLVDADHADSAAGARLLLAEYCSSLYPCSPSVCAPRHSRAALRAALDSPAPGIRAATFAWLAATDALPPADLRVGLAHAEAETRRLALELYLEAPEEATPAANACVGALLAHPDPEARSRSWAQVDGAFGSVPLALLVAAFPCLTPDELGDFASSVGCRGDDEVAPILVGLLECEAPEARFQAAHALGSLRVESAAPLLARVARVDPASAVRQAAQDALEELAQPPSEYTSQDLFSPLPGGARGLVRIVGVTPTDAGPQAPAAAGSRVSANTSAAARSPDWSAPSK